MAALDDIVTNPLSFDMHSWTLIYGWEATVVNIIAAWDSATPEQQQCGRTWYRTAHELAATVTDGLMVPENRWPYFTQDR